MKKDKSGSIEVYRLISKLQRDDILRLAKLTCKSHGHSYLAHPACAYKDGIVVPVGDKNKLALNERIGFIDIETFTFGFKADMGVMLSYCIKELNGPVITNCLSPKECQLKKDNDKRLVKELIRDLRGFTRVIGHYSTNFDIPFIRTRAVYYGFDFPIHKEIFHSDTYYMVRGRFSLKSKSLRNVCKFLGIAAKDHPFEFEKWYNAAKGDKEALHHVLTHNIEDVVSTEEVWKRINQFSLTTRKSI